MTTETATPTYGYTADKEALIKRLHRIEGQVRGIEKMLEQAADQHGNPGSDDTGNGDRRTACRPSVSCERALRPGGHVGAGAATGGRAVRAHAATYRAACVIRWFRS